MIKRPRFARTVWLLLVTLILTAQAPSGYVTVRAVQQAPVLTGFATVQSAPTVTIAALQSGVLTSLSVAPGETVQPGETMGLLGGPQIAAALAAAQGASNAANANLATEQGKFAAQLSTKATVAGQVQSIAAGPGASLQPDQPVLVVQPVAGAWVKAVIYGPQAATLSPGMVARFIPDAGAPDVHVTLQGMQGTLPDGGLVLAFSSTGLQPGEAGTLSLSLSPRPVLLVPSEALVLDDGRWWVMLHDAKGDHAVQVVPGQAEGAQTPIVSGLAAGDQVIVQDASLLYHRGIASQYQPPD